jgi:hypothetical protein
MISKIMRDKMMEFKIGYNEKCDNHLLAFITDNYEFKISLETIEVESILNHAKKVANTNDKNNTNLPEYIHFYNIDREERVFRDLLSNTDWKKLSEVLHEHLTKVVGW